MKIIAALPNAIAEVRLADSVQAVTSITMSAVA